MFRYLIGVALICSVVYFHFLSDNKKVEWENVGVNTVNKIKEENGLVSANHSAKWGISPFGKGSQIAPDQKEIILKRRQKMLADSLITPDNYFEMGIKQLSQLAESGDAFAMLQLGERYWSEADNLAYDPDANLRDDPRKIAARYFESAFHGGAINIPVVLSRRAFESGDIIEAAAWDIMARHIGQNANGDLYARSNAFSNLSVEQMNAVGVRAMEISSQLGVPLL